MVAVILMSFVFMMIENILMRQVRENDLISKVFLRVSGSRSHKYRTFLGIKVAT